MSERKTKDEKATQVIKNNSVCLVTETENYEYYIVKSIVGGKLYDIIFNKITGTFSCSCKNLRLLDCYHVEACKKLQANPLLQEM